MSFLHQTYVGDFEGSDGPCLPMINTPDDPIRKPVVRRPLDPDVVERLVSECSASRASGVIPETWSIRPENGYLTCDRYDLGVEEIHFLRRLSEETGCRFFERTFEVPVDDLSPRKQAAKAGEVPSSPASTF